MSIIARRLSVAMAEHDVSQSALARRVGATQSTVNKILQGKTTNSRYLPRIAAELGVTLAWLMGRDDSQNELAGMTDQDREWIELLRQMPAPYRARMLALSRTIARETRRRR